MRSYLIEFIGTFFLTLVIALTGNPIAIGAVLAALVYMGGYISGAHYNPAVTIGVAVRGKLQSVARGVMYILFQIAGAFVAATTYFAIKGNVFIPVPSTPDIFITLLVEILFTFLLVSVILHVATAEETVGNHYYGIAIGFTLMAIAFAGGPISGGVYNPAVAIGPILFDAKNISGHFQNLVIYITGPILGGALAAMVFRNSRQINRQESRQKAQHGRKPEVIDIESEFE